MTRRDQVRSLVLTRLVAGEVDVSGADGHGAPLTHHRPTCAGAGPSACSGSGREPPNGAPEDDLVDRVQPIPVGEAADTAGLEERGLDDGAARAPGRSMASWSASG
jgi:hypothetical protein